MAERFANFVQNPLAIELIEALITIQNCEYYLMPPGSFGYTLMLVNGYNFGNCPYAERTEKEHKACSRFARYCRTRLNQCDGWMENENGRIVMLKHRP